MELIAKVERYGHYELMPIVVTECKGMKALMGMNAQWQLECVHVLPLNGWRSRNLAEELFGTRDGGLLKLGTAMLVQASTIQALPQWDEVNQRYLARFAGVVAVEVVAIDQSYGRYITVSQIEPSLEETVTPEWVANEARMHL